MIKNFIFDSESKAIIDHRVSEEFHIPSLISIENAAFSIFQAIQDKLSFKQRIVIIIGPGNNGADGIALTRILKIKDYRVAIHIATSHLSEDGQREYAMLEKLNVEEIELSDVHKDDLIIDALFGNGIKGEIKSDYYYLVDYINDLKAYVIGIDIPSGISATSPLLPEKYIHNDLTVFIDSYPLSLFKYPSREAYNQYLLADINFPQSIKEEMSDKAIMIDSKIASSYLPQRDDEANKGTYKKALIIGGSIRMTGAIELAAKAALHSGIGTITLFIPKAIDEIAKRINEVMYIVAPSYNGYFSDEAISLLKEEITKFDIIVIGNGMGRNEASKKLLEAVLKSDKTVIVDADALYNLKNCRHLLNRSNTTILTPHLKEFSYFTDFNIADIKEDPFKCLDTFIKEYPNVKVVLKSSFTIIKDNKETYVLNRPNSALAKGGSGDVLCGIILGLCANTDDYIKALVSASYVHSCSANEKYDPNYFTASGLIDELNNTYLTLRKRKKGIE